MPVKFRDYYETLGVPRSAKDEDIKKVAPKAKLRLIRQATEEDFHRGNVDLILWHRPPDGPFFKQVACESRYVTIARKGNPVVRNAPLSLAEFAQVPQVTMEGCGDFHVDIDATIDKALAETGLVRNKVVAISSLLAVKRLVGSTDLIATVPDVLLTSYEPDVKLEVVKTELDLKPVDVYLIWHQRTNAHPAHRWFRSFILEQYDRFNGKQPAPTAVASRAR